VRDQETATGPSGEPSLAGRPGEPPLCSVEGLDKHYGGVHALKSVSLDFQAGQVHAIVGENGAGKSTLMRILAGVEHADEGLIKVDGQTHSFGSGADANAAGIAIVFQELSLYPDVDVLANLFARREPRRWGLVRRREMRRLAEPLLDQVGLSVDLDARLETLSLDERQLVEITKALLVHARIVILDEPTSALTSRETERLFGVIRGLRERGAAVLFVSHRLEEVFAIADVISVIRDGSHVATAARADTDIEEVVTHMIGRRPAELPTRPRRSHIAQERLSVRELSRGRQFTDISFDVELGEVVGVAGLEDAGIRPLMRTIFGVLAPDGGEVSLPQRTHRASSATAAVRAGVAYVPADRRVGGLCLEQSVTENVCQVTAGVMHEFGPLLSRRAMREATERHCAQLSIKLASVDAPVARLSGGNQQKVVLAKWMAADPRVFLLDDPTRGVDIGAKLEIYDHVRRLAESGCAVLFYSSELAEYEYTCHRVIVMRRGRITGELVGDDVTEQRLLHGINIDAADAEPATAADPAS
jgi:rhamnose transport system ATP-binding protein